MITHIQMTAIAYSDALTIAWAWRPEIAASLTDYRHPTTVDGDAYLAEDGQSGFIVRDGELCGVFSLVKGRGDAIMRDALAVGATHLDCFDGFLPTFYARHGFRETSREANWTPDGPDVVYMALETAAVPA